MGLLQVWTVFIFFRRPPNVAPFISLQEAKLLLLGLHSIYYTTNNNDKRQRKLLLRCLYAQRRSAPRVKGENDEKILALLFGPLRSIWCFPVVFSFLLPSSSSSYYYYYYSFFFPPSSHGQTDDCGALKWWRRARGCRHRRPQKFTRFSHRRWGLFLYIYIYTRIYYTRVASFSTTTTTTTIGLYNCGCCCGATI